MKTRETAGSKKQSIIVKDLKTRKNPKGGGGLHGEGKLVKIDFCRK